MRLWAEVHRLVIYAVCCNSAGIAYNRHTNDRQTGLYVGTVVMVELTREMVASATKVAVETATRLNVCGKNLTDVRVSTLQWTISMHLGVQRAQFVGLVEM